MKWQGTLVAALPRALGLLAAAAIGALVDTGLMDGQLGDALLLVVRLLAP